MSSLSKARSVLFALFFAGGAAAALGWVWYAVDAFGHDLEEGVQTIANERTFESQFNELTTMVASTEETRTTLKRYVLQDEGDTIQLLSTFDEIARYRGVEFATSRLEVEERDGSFNDLEVSFSMEGSERAVTDMIRMFESLPYHGSIVSLRFTRAAGDDDAGLVSADISLLLSIEKYDQ